MAYHGVAIMDHNTLIGINTRRRNPKKKGRLPYHAKRLFSLPVIESGPRKCFHAIAQHELILDQNQRPITISYALPCKVGHKATTKNPTHKTGKVSWK